MAVCCSASSAARAESMGAAAASASPAHADSIVQRQRLGKSSTAVDEPAQPYSYTECDIPIDVLTAFSWLQPQTTLDGGEMVNFSVDLSQTFQTGTYMGYNNWELHSGLMSGSSTVYGMNNTCLGRDLSGGYIPPLILGTHQPQFIVGLPSAAMATPPAPLILLVISYPTGDIDSWRIMERDVSLAS